MQLEVHAQSESESILMSAVISKPNALFRLGTLWTTLNVKSLKQEGKLSNAILLRLVYRHQCGDWSDCCPEDAEANRQALINGSRIFSVYHVNPELTLWIITEAEDNKGIRRATTILLPGDY